MKKFIAFSLCAAMALSLAACGDNSITASSAPAADASVSASAPDAPSEPETSDAPTLSSVTVDLSDVQTEEHTADDGTLLLSISTQQPKLENPDELAALTAIQADIDSEVNTIMHPEDEDPLAAAQYDYEQAAADDREFVPSSEELTFTVQRNDGVVLSLVGSLWSYGGGPHGNTYTFCLNYNVSTGARITLETLGQAFIDTATQLVLDQAAAKNEETPGLLIDDYATYIGDVVSDDTFYFTDDAVVFVSGEYVIQSYAAGIIEFPVPYLQLSSVLPEAYKR